MKSVLYTTEDDQKKSESLIQTVNEKFIKKATLEFNTRKTAKGRVPDNRLVLILSETSYALYLTFDGGKAIVMTSAAPGEKKLTFDMVKENVYSAMGKIAGKGLVYLFRKSEINPAFI